MTQAKKKEVQEVKPQVINNDADLSPDEDAPRGLKGKLSGFDAQNIIVTVLIAMVAAFILTSFITPFTSFNVYKNRVTLFENELVVFPKMSGAS